MRLSLLFMYSHLSRRWALRSVFKLMLFLLKRMGRNLNTPHQEGAAVKGKSRGHLQTSSCLPFARPVVLMELLILYLDHEKTHPSDGLKDLRKKGRHKTIQNTIRLPLSTELESSLLTLTYWIRNCLECG